MIKSNWYIIDKSKMNSIILNEIMKKIWPTEMMLRALDEKSDKSQLMGIIFELSHSRNYTRKELVLKFHPTQLPCKKYYMRDKVFSYKTRDDIEYFKISDIKTKFDGLISHKNIDTEKQIEHDRIASVKKNLISDIYSLAGLSNLTTNTYMYADSLETVQLNFNKMCKEKAIKLLELYKVLENK